MPIMTQALQGHAHDVVRILLLILIKIDLITGASFAHYLHILLVFVFPFCLVLEPYKYAGYPMLIKTIQLETRDDRLFSKTAHLLTAACELAFHTVNCSALNAEELCREQGIEVSVVVVVFFPFHDNL